jgi:hypothetical protein
MVVEMGVVGPRSQPIRRHNNFAILQPRPDTSLVFAAISSYQSSSSTSSCRSGAVNSPMSKRHIIDTQSKAVACKS